MIQVQHLSKRFGGTVALRDVSLDFLPGEVHAICGENGAGKSTLNRILAGLIEPDEGTVSIDGSVITLGSVTQAESVGIVMVHQESATFLHLTAVENHELNHEPGSVLWMDRLGMLEHTKASLSALGASVDLERPLAELSSADRQMVSIARALAARPRLLILDEPTSMLGARETRALFDAIHHLTREGASVVYVSHRLEEIAAIADRVTVLRDGQWVATLPVQEATRGELVRLMAGQTREREAVDRQESPGEPRLSVQGITRIGEFEDVTFEVRSGEIVVLAGLVGAGRSEVVRAIFGLNPLDSGSIVAKGRVALVPEDRQHEGLHVSMTVRDNVAMALQRPALRDRAAEAALSSRMISELQIKARSDLDPVADLSGGNQQKVLLGKWLATEPDIVLLDEPTRGVDVNAKAQIHRVIRGLARQGKAVLVVSSDMAEVLELADRVVVLREGRVAGALDREQATEEAVLNLALPGVESPRRPATPQPAGRHAQARPAGLLALLLLVVSLVNPAFLTAANFVDILVKTAPVVMVGVAMTLVILAREIDISVGALMGLCAAALGIAASPDRLGLPVPVAVAVCLGVGVAGGLVSGLLVAKVRIPSIVATLGMMSIYRATTEIAMGGKWVENLPAGLREFGTGKLLGVPHGVTAAGIAVLLGLWVTRRTRLGLRVYALGSNPQAAAMRGVPSDRLRLVLFGLVGLATAMATLFSATQLQVVESGFGAGYELTIIAAVVVGGTSIRGGVGSIWGSVVGALLLGAVSTILIFLKLGDSATYWERAIQGGLILLAVTGDAFLRRGAR